MSCSNAVNAPPHILCLPLRTPAVPATGSHTTRECLCLPSSLPEFPLEPGDLFSISAGQPRSATDDYSWGNTEPVKARDSFPFLKGQLCSAQQDRTSFAHNGHLAINTLYWLYPFFVLLFPLLHTCSWDGWPDQLSAAKSIPQSLLPEEPNLKHVRFTVLYCILYAHSWIEKLQSLRHYEIELVTCIISYFYLFIIHILVCIYICICKYVYIFYLSTYIKSTLDLMFNNSRNYDLHLCMAPEFNTVQCKQ